MKDLVVKSIITVVALGILVLHALRPELQIDVISFGLLVTAALPWLSSIVASAEFPGGWKITFQELKKAGDKITEGTSTSNRDAPAPSYIAVAETDPNLALVGLRIEIETRLRALARRYDLAPNRSLTQTVRELQNRGILNDPSVSGLQELVMAGNQAAHGVRVERDAADWAIQYGPRVLAVLDEKLSPA